MARTPARGNGTPPTHLMSRPGDAVIRRELRLHLAALHAAEPATVLLDELGLKRRAARADVVVVNGVLHGYEIKSDRDSLRRLKRQVPIYGEVFEWVTLVAGERHANSAADLVPPWWGILSVAGSGPRVRFGVLRKGAPNPRLSPRALVELLWRDAAIALLDTKGGSRGLRSKPRREIWDRICELCSVEEISAAVRKALTARSEHGPAAQPR